MNFSSGAYRNCVIAATGRNAVPSFLLVNEGRGRSEEPARERGSSSSSSSFVSTVPGRSTVMAIRTGIRSSRTGRSSACFAPYLRSLLREAVRTGRRIVPSSSPSGRAERSIGLSGTDSSAELRRAIAHARVRNLARLSPAIYGGYSESRLKGDVRDLMTCSGSPTLKHTQVGDGHSRRAITESHVWCWGCRVTRKTKIDTQLVDLCRHPRWKVLQRFPQLWKLCDAVFRPVDSPAHI